MGLFSVAGQRRFQRHPSRKSALGVYRDGGISALFVRFSLRALPKLNRGLREGRASLSRKREASRPGPLAPAGLCPVRLPRGANYFPAQKAGFRTRGLAGVAWSKKTRRVIPVGR